MNKIILILLSLSIMACQNTIDTNGHFKAFDLSANSLTNSTPVVLADPVLAVLPKAVVFIKYVDTEKVFSCSGVLIAPFKILTAGHCFFDVNNLPTQDQKLNKNKLNIQYGDVTTDSANMKTLNGNHILSVEVHKDFFKDQSSKDKRPGNGEKNAIYDRSDVALITLDPSQLVNTIHFEQFKALPDFYTVDDGTIDKENPDNFSYSMLLAYTFFPTFSGAATPNAHLRFAIGKPHLFILASKPGIIHSTIKHHKHANIEIGLCSGDSGSPLFYKIKESKDKHILVGIVTGGVADNDASNCSSSAIFSLIHNHHEWLKY